MGHPQSEESKKKIGLANSGKKHPKLRKFNKSRKGKSYEDIFGEKKSKEIKAKLRAAWKRNNWKPHNKGKKHSKESMEKTVAGIKDHNREVMRYLKTMEKDGYRCIPIIRVFPDIIAIKNNQVFAVEIERRISPNWTKYEDYNVRKYFDDVVWILTRYKKIKMRHT
jgi:hypothetical protein